jgi:YD repeat-containing protein
MTDSDFQDGPIAEEQASAAVSPAAAGVASGLRILRGLGYATNFGRTNSCSPTFIWGRTHPLIGHVAGGGRRWKLSRATHGQRVARRFNMSGSRIQLAHAVDFLAHSFERRSEHLFVSASASISVRPPRATDWLKQYS